jgi:hypothetical protein
MVNTWMNPMNALIVPKAGIARIRQIHIDATLVHIRTSHRKQPVIHAPTGIPHVTMARSHAKPAPNLASILVEMHTKSPHGNLSIGIPPQIKLIIYARSKLAILGIG